MYTRTLGLVHVETMEIMDNFSQGTACASREVNGLHSKRKDERMKKKVGKSSRLYR